MALFQVMGWVGLRLLLAGVAGPPQDPLDLASLYEHRFRFDAQGRPSVTVGLMDGQSQIVVTASGPWLLRFSNGVVEKTLPQAAGSKVTVSLKESSVAKVKRWAVLQTLEKESRLHRDEAVARWQSVVASPLRTFEVGGVYGVEGTVVDNRATLLATAPPAELELPALMQHLYEKTGARPRVHEELLEVPKGVLLLRDDSGALLGTARDLVEATPLPGGEVTVEHVENAMGYAHHGFETRAYDGKILVAVDAQGKLCAINALDVDRLLQGIVPSEIFPNAPLEALKAQAVTARGEVFAKVGVRHLLDPYVLCDEQHCQVYSGVRAERPACNTAVTQTRGEMAFWGGHLVDSVYSSMCGGRTEDNDVVWEVPPNAALRGAGDVEPARTPGGAGKTKAPFNLSSDAALRAFLRNPPPAFCAQATLGKKDKFRWTRRLTVEDVTQKCGELGVGPVTSVAVEARGPGGRVRTLKVMGTQGTAFVHRELPVRRLLGNLPSGMFVVDAERATPLGPVTAYIFTGGGFGHGVGMCQTGAVGMAEAGHDYRSILRHYYNGAVVTRVYE